MSLCVSIVILFRTWPQSREGDGHAAESVRRGDSPVHIYTGLACLSSRNYDVPADTQIDIFTDTHMHTPDDRNCLPSC